MTSPSWRFGLSADATRVAATGLVASAQAEGTSEPLDAAAWNALRAETAHHRLEGLLVAAATNGDLATTPEQSTELAELEIDLTRSRMWHEARLAEYVDLLADAGIEARLLKGPALARLDYPDPQMRPTRDLDLLVRGEQIDAASAVLVEAGGTRLDPDPVPGFVATVGKGATVALPDGLEVDLHRLLVWGPLGVRVPAADLWRADRPLDINGHTYRTLPVEESLLHACLHLLVLGWRRALTLRDVAQLAHHPGLDVDRLLRLSRRWGSDAVLASSLALAEDELGSPNPEPLQAWVAAHTPSARDRAWMRVERPDDPVGLFEAPATFLELHTGAERRMLAKATFRPEPGTWPTPWARIPRGLRNLRRQGPLRPRPARRSARRDEASPPAVLRIHHASVIRAWRERDEELRRAGIDVSLATARTWNEGGRDVAAVADVGEPLLTVGTIGHHPYRFVFNPLPVWRELRRRPLDVLDIHEEPASLAAAEVQALAVLAGRGRVPISLYSAQNIAKRYPPPFRWLERIALRRAAAVHVCNDDVGRVLRHKGFDGAIVNLGLGVDLEQFHPAEPDPDTDTDTDRELVELGYVGRLEDYKGVTVLVEAMGELPGFHLTIVGDGPLRDELSRQVTALGIDGRVTFRGFLGEGQLPDFYRAIDILVVPSLETPTWIEQFGRVAIEAMASGVPVVASATGALPEVLGGSGVLVPPDDASALAAAIAELGTDSARRAASAAAGLERCELYSWTSIASRQAALYRDLIDAG